MGEAAKQSDINRADAAQTPKPTSKGQKGSPLEATSRPSKQAFEQPTAPLAVGARRVRAPPYRCPSPSSPSFPGCPPSAGAMLTGPTLRYTGVSPLGYPSFPQSTASIVLHSPASRSSRRTVRLPRLRAPTVAAPMTPSGPPSPPLPRTGRVGSPPPPDTRVVATRFSATVSTQSDAKEAAQRLKLTPFVRDAQGSAPPTGTRSETARTARTRSTATASHGCTLRAARPSRRQRSG